MSRTWGWTEAVAEDSFALKVTVWLISRSRRRYYVLSCIHILSTTSSRIQRPSTRHKVFNELHIHLLVTFLHWVLQGHFHIDLIWKPKWSVAPISVNFLKLGSFTVSFRSLSRSLYFRLLISIGGRIRVRCIWSEGVTAARLSFKISKRIRHARSVRWLTCLWTPKLSWVSWSCRTFLQIFSRS